MTSIDTLLLGIGIGYIIIALAELLDRLITKWKDTNV